MNSYSFPSPVAISAKTDSGKFSSPRKSGSRRTLRVEGRYHVAADRGDKV